MRRFFKAFFTELKRSVLSAGFPAMILLVAAAYMAGSVEEIKFVWNGKSADILYLFGLIHNVGSFTRLSVLCCTVLNCVSFLRDHKSGYYRFCVMRSGKKTYAVAKYLSCAVSGGAILALGMALYMLILKIKFPFISETSSSLENYARGQNFMGELLREEKFAAYFAAYALLAFMFGALWSCVGIAVSAFFEDYYAASFAPYVISFASNNILSGFFRPDVILHANFNLGGVAKSLLGAALYFGAIIAILAVIFCIKAERRCAE